MVKSSFSLVEAAVCCTLTALVTYSYCYHYCWLPRDHNRPHHETRHKDDNRTRSASARDASPHDETLSTAHPAQTDATQESASIWSVRPVGTVRSIYRLCVGTPRQGLLAPQARGKIEVTLPEAHHVVDGLEAYSHVWIIFMFHLNTRPSHRRKQPTKISPPALGGRGKVGVWATRSPHRPNPIGITLVRLERVETAPKYVSGQKTVHVTSLHVSGLDLVDGTPVLDVKPYVPTYDAPGQIESNNTVSDHPLSVKLPPWVSQGLVTRRPVEIIDAASSELLQILFDNPNALEFYRGKDAYRDFLECLQQVLAMDVRSTYQTAKSRQGKFQAERAVRVAGTRLSNTESGCTQQLDNVLIHYTVHERNVDERQRPESQGSGAEDCIIVSSIRLL
jgi:tRNA-Thr(GGU) m(6)t(6)A37 methyltransferase TsaA